MGSQVTANPEVDPGTRLPGTAAPGFTLTNQFGSRVSLSQFRGKAVVLAFVDSECTTICPLSTVSMTEAVAMLGPAAAKHIQLLGIDANPDATAVSDVRAYSTAHEMLHSWNFLTGSRSQLEAVWRDYHVYVAASHGDIDHEPAIYLVDPDGHERILYLTQMAYASVEQQAELIANGLSQVLPGHPALHGGVSMALAKPIGAAAAVRLPVIAGDRSIQQVQFGAGHPHVVVFVTSWIGEVSDLQAQLQALTRYQHEAIQHGWPTVVAVDETKSETTPAALPQLLARTGVTKLDYPIVADTSGRVADGYGVQDIPWVEVITPAGDHLQARRLGVRGRAGPAGGPREGVARQLAHPARRRASPAGRPGRPPGPVAVARRPGQVGQPAQQLARLGGVAVLRCPRCTRLPATSSRTEASPSRRWTGPWTQRMLCTFSSGTQVVFRHTRPREATT